MAETAKIVNPDEDRRLPDLDAGCSLERILPAGEAGGVSRGSIAEKNYYVIAYINCSAGVKALSDVICTSGNAVKIVKRAPKDRNILFVPDQNLGAWVMEQTGRQMDLWQGQLLRARGVHARQSIERIRDRVSRRAVVAHPGMHLRGSHSRR